MLHGPFVGILATWVLLGAVCYGLGAGLLRAAGASRPIGNAVVTMAIGASAWMAAAQISRFFTAATSWGLAAAAAAAVPGYIWGRHGWGRPTPRGAASALAWLGAGAWLAALSLREIRNYDMGLYHYDAVRWAQAFPLIPGLANLHDRLGFNSTIFVLSAMIDEAPFGQAAHLVLAGFFAWLWAGWTAIEALRDPGAGDIGIARAFAVASLPVFVEWAAGNEIPSLSPDIPIACFFLIVTGECLRLARPGRSPGERQTALAAMVWLAATAATAKLSALGLLGGVALVSVVHAVAARRRGDRAAAARRPVRAFVALAAISVATWAGGNVILSGYPMYPSVIGGMPVDWRVPPQMAEATSAWVRSWARLPWEPFYDYLTGAPWLAPWWRAIPARWLIQLAAAAILAAAAGVLGWRARRRFPWEMAAALTPIGASLVYWFATAPDPRFSGSGATIALAGATALLAAQVPSASIGVLMAVLVAVTAGLSLGRTQADRLTAPPRFWRAAAAAPPTIAFQERATDSGLRIAVPTNRAQSSWGQRLPATYQFNPKLALRDPADMKRGFHVTDPAFLAIGWPWQRLEAATIDDRTFGTFVHGWGDIDEVLHYQWLRPPVRMIVYSLEPRAAVLHCDLAFIQPPAPPSPPRVTVFAGARRVGDFAVAVGTVVDLRFTLDRGFTQILFVQDWGERRYRFTAAKTPAGTPFGCANYRFTAEAPSR